jgi:hypothetical protein
MLLMRWCFVYGMDLLAANNNGTTLVLRLCKELRIVPLIVVCPQRAVVEKRMKPRGLAVVVARFVHAAVFWCGRLAKKRCEASGVATCSPARSSHT